ncbi:MAG: hypothetical protein ABR540_01215 [Acidimicrobiales bacterium]
MNKQEAADTLRHLESVQDQTRGELQAFWFPLVVFGALTLASAPFGLTGSGGAVGLFWAFAGPAGGAAVGWYYHSREQRLGVARSAVPYVITAAALLVAAFVLPALTRGDLREVVSCFAVAAAYLVFARLDRSVALAAVALVLAAVPAIALATGVERPGVVTAVISGAIFLATGLVFRRQAAHSELRRAPSER